MHDIERANSSVIPPVWWLIVGLAAVGCAGWTEGVSTGVDQAQLSTAQLTLRVFPTLAAVLLLVTTRLPRSKGLLNASLRMPWAPFTVAIAISLTGWLLFGRPVFALWKSIEFLSPVFLGATLTILPREYAEQTLQMIIRVSAAIVSSTLIFAVLIPSRSVRLTGLGGSPQVWSLYPILGPGAVGLLAASLVIAVLANVEIKPGSRHRVLWQFATGFLGLVGLLASQSRGAAIALFVVVTLSTLQRAKERSGMGAVATWIVTTTGGLSVLWFAPFILTRGNSQSFVTLSNRTLRWQEAIALARENPIWGNGLGVSARFEDINVTGRQVSQGFGQSHNGYLEIALAVGLPAALFLTVALVRLAVKNRKKNPDIFTNLSGRLLWLLLIAGIVDSFVLTYSPVILLLVGAIGVLSRSDAQDRPKPALSDRSYQAVRRNGPRRLEARSSSAPQ